MEFALVAPVLVLLLAGIIDYGWYFFAQETLTDATYLAAREGSLTTWDDSPLDEAEGLLEETLDGSVLSGSSRTLSVSYVGLPPELKLEIVVEAEYRVLLGLLPMPSTATSRVTMLLEDQPDSEEYEYRDGGGALL